MVMYQIRFCYKNDDKKIKKDVAYHIYDSYETYEEAYEEMKLLIGICREIKFEEIVFAYSFPKRKIEPYVLFLSKKGKHFATIVSE